MPPIVTAIRPRGGDRVEIHLDGVPWRTIPLGAAVEARLAPGLHLDRSRVCELNVAIRRQAALVAGVHALRHVTHTRKSLERRLAERGVRDAERAHALSALERAGYVDDKRVATGRASELARRGCGNAMIAADLADRGVSDEHVSAAIAALEPEDVRAAEILARRGAGASVARYLAARGFADEVIEETVAGISADAVG